MKATGKAGGHDLRHGMISVEMFQLVQIGSAQVHFSA
jgi:hypothetical protein